MAFQEGSFTSDGNAKILSFGSEVLSMEIQNLTQYNSSANPGELKRAFYNKSQPDGSYFGVKNTDGAATDESIYAASNGFTVVDQGAEFADVISGFTNANPGVISVDQDPSDFGIAAGDTIVVGGVRETYDASKTSLNGEFTVASVTSSAITLVEDTSNYRVYSSGGVCYDKAEPTNNIGAKGIQLGSALVGSASDVIYYKVELQDAE